MIVLNVKVLPRLLATASTHRTTVTVRSCLVGTVVQFPANRMRLLAGR